jgi:hypothetical protein
VPRGRPREDKVLYFDEVLDLALLYLPTVILNTPFLRQSKYESISSLRRKPRVDANGLKARRSTGTRKWESWVDVQTITFKKEIGKFGRF